MSSTDARVHGGPHDAELRALGLDYADILDFSASTNPYGPCEEMLDAVRGAALDRYPDPSAFQARRAVGESLDVCPDEIVLGNGASELLWSLAAALLPWGSRALIVEPTFCEFRAACVARGAPTSEWRAVEERGFTIVLDAVAEAARRDSAAVVYLCAPNTPTGFCLPARDIAEWATAQPGLSVILDQSFLTLSDRHADGVVPMPPNVVCVRSLTKDHAIPGVRIGYAIAPADVVRRIDRHRPAWTVGAAAQAAAIAACRLSGFVSESRRTLLDDRRALHHDLERLGLRPHDSSTVFLLARVGDAGSLHRRLLARHSILVRDCASFGLPDFIRLAARPAEDRAALARALTACVEEKETRRC